jgi:hypothetical protein
VDAPKEQMSDPNDHILKGCFFRKDLIDTKQGIAADSRLIVKSQTPSISSPVRTIIFQKSTKLRKKKELDDVPRTLFVPVREESPSVCRREKGNYRKRAGFQKPMFYKLENPETIITLHVTSESHAIHVSASQST